jgi:arylsulfatase A-like enzyme
VVVDCLRRDDFQEILAASPDLSWLKRESVVFPNCFSVSNWTIPAHVSILTGLFPFEHQVHRLGLRQIPPELPTIATSLSQLGYATQLISANHNLSPQVGFGTGFDYVAWGMWGETAFRFTSGDRPPFDSRSASNVDLLRSHVLDADPEGLWKIARNAAEILPRYPWALDAVSRAHAGLYRSGAARDYRVAPWVEPSLIQAVQGTPPDRPLFAMVNLMDCHEPYLPEPEFSRGVGHWAKLVSRRQDVGAWVRGRWLPTADELGTLRELYRQKVKVVGTRIANLVTLLKQADRWDNTLFILTADHGQAFGEHGQLFHSGELFEQVTHVPLWVRYPRALHGGTTAEAPASLVDLYPTVMEAVNGTRAGPWSGVPLGDLIDGSRQQPAISAADGIRWFGSAAAPPPRPCDLPQVAVYSDEYKLLFDHPTGRSRAYRIAEDPEESFDLWPELNARLHTLWAKARAVGDRMAAPLFGAGEGGGSARLRSWGYLD